MTIGQNLVVITLLIALQQMEAWNSVITPRNFRPCCAATWSFGCLAVNKARSLLLDGHPAVEAVEKGINVVELDTGEQYYVGAGGFPNSDGMMELDAAIMDHDCRYGAVMSLPNIATPISVARTVMEKCQHNVLTGQGALKWALENQFHSENILLPHVKAEWEQWKAETNKSPSNLDESHDTVGLICIDRHGRLAAGTSTSGWRFKLPGRVGDSPLIGSGLYCDGNAGAAVATGDGEEIMRVCLSFLVVEYIRMGMEVQEACVKGIERVLQLKRGNDDIEKMHPKLVVGVVAMDCEGNVGAASTLNSQNLHRGASFFPVACWREDDRIDPSRLSTQMLEADVLGAKF